MNHKQELQISGRGIKEEGTEIGMLFYNGGSVTGWYQNGGSVTGWYQNWGSVTGWYQEGGGL